MNTKIFIKKALIKHNNKYNYEKTNFAGSKNKVKIICPIHGEFEQRAALHLYGGGCPECSGNVRLTLDEFISRANIIHGNKYDYSKVDYKGHAYKVTITCAVHGDFIQTANKHLSGDGCPECAEENKGWSYSRWEKAGLNSNKFTGFKFYIIKCWNDDESFYKVGKTFNSLSRRFLTEVKMPYRWKVIELIEGDARTISETEINYKQLNIQNSYTPEIKFKGMSECFSDIKYIKEEE